MADADTFEAAERAYKERNYVTAFSLYSLAAEAGHATAQAKLGLCLQLGRGCQRDMAQAIKLFQDSHELGDAEGTFQLGLCHYRGFYVGDKSVRVDETKANELFLQAAKQGHVLAKARCLFDGIDCKQDQQQSFEIHQSLEGTDDPEIDLQLGWCYMEGSGTTKDLQRALLYYFRSAKAGHPVSQFNIGWQYDYGPVLERNGPLAVQWYRASAESGYPRPFINLTLCYANGRGIPPNQRQALHYSLLAHAAGDTGSTATAGVYFDRGVGVREDARIAVALWTEGAEKGNARCQFELGCAYLSDDVETDRSLAFKYLQLAASQNYPRASRMIADYQLTENG